MDIAQTLDMAFHALANPTRRSVIERLGHGSAPVSDLAKPFDMALPSFMQHLKVLEKAGLVRSWKKGRVRTVRLAAPEHLEHAARWLDQHRVMWNRRLDQLDAYLDTMEEDECASTPRSTRPSTWFSSAWWMFPPNSSGEPGPNRST